LPPATVRRGLNDGGQHRIVKMFYRPEELTTRLTELGWAPEIHQAGDWLLAGTATPRIPTAERRAPADASS